MSKNLTPLKAIHAKCVDCVCGIKSEVRKCPSLNCPLYEFRLGKNPYIPRKQLTDEEIQALKERLKNAKKGA